MNIVSGFSKNEKIRLTAITLGIYFFILPMDCMQIWGSASVLRIYAVIPIITCLLSGQARYFKLSKLSKLPIIYLAWVFISLLYSISFEQTLSSALSLALNLTLVLVMGCCYSYNDREKRMLLMCLVLSAWFAAGSMVIFGDYSVNGRLTLAYGDTAQDANYTNGYMLFGFSFHLSRFLRKKNLMHLILAFGLFVVMLLTGSRGAMIAYILCIIFCVTLEVKNGKRPIQALILTCIMAFVAYQVFNIVLNSMDAAVSSRFSAEYLLEHGTTGRSDIWINLLEKFKGANILRELFGHGYGTSAMLNTTTSVTTAGMVAHNLWIDNLITIGIIGVIIQITMQANYIRVVLKTHVYTMICAYGAFLVMCMSLSLTNYKPIWCAMIMIMLLADNGNNQEYGDIWEC